MTPTEIQRVFPVVCADVFDAILAGHGFSRGAARTTPTYCSQQYLAGERYIEINANVDYRDAPFAANVILGEGSPEWPERDWNAIALWRLVEHEFPAARAADACNYRIGERDDLSKTLAPLFMRARGELLQYARPFLSGDLVAFLRVRAAQNTERQPYQIFAPDGQGGLKQSVDQDSNALKERFSREDG